MRSRWNAHSAVTPATYKAIPASTAAIATVLKCRMRPRARTLAQRAHCRRTLWRCARGILTNSAPQCRRSAAYAMRLALLVQWRQQRRARRRLLLIHGVQHDADAQVVAHDAEQVDRVLP